MNRMQKLAARSAHRVDLPAAIIAALPQITLTGFEEITVDMQQGLQSFSEKEIVVRVTMGTVIIRGSDLRIVLMKEGRIAVCGQIDEVLLEREREP